MDRDWKANDRKHSSFYLHFKKVEIHRWSLKGFSFNLYLFFCQTRQAVWRLSFLKSTLFLHCACNTVVKVTLWTVNVFCQCTVSSHTFLSDMHVCFTHLEVTADVSVKGVLQEMSKKWSVFLVKTAEGELKDILYII